MNIVKPKGSEMKLKLKAYKCVLSGFCDYSDNMWVDEFETIYGVSQKEAVKEYCQSDENYSYWELKEHIRTRRYKEADLYSQDKSELLNDLTGKQIKHLMHSLGVRIGDRFKGEFTRNYSFYYEKQEGCENLVRLGLMRNWRKLESEVYSVSEKGIEAVKTLLLITKSK